jgi:hypothetical protein
MTRHNKKRNAGLLYEFLVRGISRSLVEDNTDKANNIKRIVKKFFKEGTELHREYRLINAMVNVPVGSELLAVKILEEAKSAAQKFDSERLRQEKSELIREINHRFGKNEMYGQDVPGYKDYATASSLVSYWRGEKHLDLQEVANFEKIIVGRLARKEEPQAELNELKDENVDNLVVKIATDKIQKKYSSKLSSSQTEILNTYVFNESVEELEKMRNSVCSKALSVISNKSNLEGLGEYTLGKLKDTTGKISSLMSENIDDALIEKLMKVSELTEELLGDKK